MRLPRWLRRRSKPIPPPSPEYREAMARWAITQEILRQEPDLSNEEYLERFDELWARVMEGREK